MLAVIRPSKPVPPWKPMWSPTVMWSRPAAATPVEQPLPGAEVGQREGVLVRDPDLDRCHGELPSGRAWI